MMPPRSTSTHIRASVRLPAIGSSVIPQRAAEEPIGPANARLWGASTAVTCCARPRVRPSIPCARCSTLEPGPSGAPPTARHSRTPGAHSGQRPTSQTYAHTSGTLPEIVMRLSVLTAIRRRLCRSLAVASVRQRRYIPTDTPANDLRQTFLLHLRYSTWTQYGGEPTIGSIGTGLCPLGLVPRRRRSRSTTSTTAPGRLATSTRTP